MLSGSLVWNRLNSSYPRTLAEFHLSLTLSSLQYFDKGEEDEILMPGVLMFGDEKLAENLYLKVSRIRKHSKLEGGAQTPPTTLQHIGMHESKMMAWISLSVMSSCYKGRVRE